MTEQLRTEEELHGLISSFREALNLYNKNLNPGFLAGLKATKEIEPSVELEKLSKLVFAYSTKIGIAFRPPVSINAAFGQIKESSEVFSVLLGIASGFTIDKFGSLFRNEIIQEISALVSRYMSFLDELESLDLEQKKLDLPNHTGDGRLISVGRVWEACKKIQKTLNDGKIGLLKYRIALSISLLEDGTSELEEWLENPEVLDDFDPFGLNTQTESQVDEDEEEEQKVDPLVLDFAQKWVTKIKLLKLLLSSLSKSLPTEEASVSGPDTDNFNKEQEKLVEHTDDLIANIFMNSELSKLEELAQTIIYKSDLLIDLVKSLNKNDEKKTRWLVIWQGRFKQ